MNHKTIGNIGQWLSVFIMIAGTVLMISYRLDYGTILFTTGCLVETLATKVKYYGDQYIERCRKVKEISLYKCEDKIENKAIVDSDLISRAEFL